MSLPEFGWPECNGTVANHAVAEAGGDDLQRRKSPPIFWGSPNLQNYTPCNRICHLPAAASRERLKIRFICAADRWGTLEQRLSIAALGRSVLRFTLRHLMPASFGFRKAVWVLALVAASCGDSNPIGPSNQPEIANIRDNFQFQASNLSQTTQTLSYTWENTGTNANVNQSGVISSGTATLTIRAPSGAEVYSRALSTTGTFPTGSAPAGNWQIDVRLENVSGTLNFRIQRP